MREGFLDNDEVDRSINFGASICKKIKQLRPNVTWMKIPALFDAVKEKGHQYFPDVTYVEMLRSIDRNFSLEDIEEAISVKHNENVPRRTTKGLENEKKDTTESVSN